MPPRRPKKAKPSVKAAIKSSEIIKRLNNHIHNTPNKRYYIANYMDPSQVTAALGLLRKEVPDLAATKIDISGDVKIKVLHVASHKAAE
jgi:hypothetical protein